MCIPVRSTYTQTVLRRNYGALLGLVGSIPSLWFFEQRIYISRSLSGNMKDMGFLA